MMGLTVNALEEGDWAFTGQTVPSAWTATNATLQTTRSEYKYQGYGSLKSSLSASSATISFNENNTSTTAQTTTEYVAGKVESFVWCRATATATITPQLTITRVMAGTPVEGVDIFTAYGSPVSLTSGDWYLVRTNPVVVPVSPATAHYHISLQYAISGATIGSSVLFHFPTAYEQLAFLRNTFLMDCWDNIPAVFQNRETELPLPSYALLRFMEIGMQAHGVINDIAAGFQYQDISEGKDETNGDTLSILVQPSEIPRDYIFWVAQFTGTQLLNPTAGATPWANIPSTWDGIDLIDTVDDPDDVVEWGSLQGFAPEIAGLDDFFRWQVASGYYGYAAGSMAAIREATKRVLGGTKTCTITKNYLSSPWRIRIQTKLSETPDASTVGESIDEMLQLMELARPLGVVLTHEIIA
jgi:hypothetical protein